MSSILEQLGVQTKGLEETMSPFEAWEGSSVRQWQVTMEMVTMGDLVEITKFTGNVTPLEVAYLTKVYLLAKCIKTINGREIVTSEELADYNKAHNLAGNTIISLFEYKIIFIKKLSEMVVNRLTFLYDELSNKYVASLLGRGIVPDELDATKFNMSEESVSDSDKGEESIDNESNNSSTTA